MNIISPHIESIIIRQLDQQATEAELAILEEWLSESSSHQETYQGLLRIWQESQAAALQHPFDTAAAWEKVSQRIQAQGAKLVRLQQWSRALSVAAVVVVAIGLPALYFNSRTPTESAAWQTVKAAGNQVIRLYDGTQVSLRNGSTLRYPRRFSQDYRHVTLEGEAYFEVLHDESRPFRITTGQAVVTDLGTAFLLRTSDSAAQVVVTEGQVSLARKSDPAQQLTLAPGEKGELSNNRLSKTGANTKNLLAWKIGTLQFEQTPLSEVTADLENYFDVQFLAAPGIEAGKVRVTVRFHRQPLEEVLEELQLMTGLSFERNGQLVTIGR